MSTDTTPSQLAEVKKAVAGQILRAGRDVFQKAFEADPGVMQALYDAKIGFDPEKFKDVDIVAMKGEDLLGFLGAINSMFRGFTDERLAVMTGSACPSRVVGFAVIDARGQVIE